MTRDRHALLTLVGGACLVLGCSGSTPRDINYGTDAQAGFEPPFAEAGTDADAAADGTAGAAGTAGTAGAAGGADTTGTAGAAGGAAGAGTDASTDG
jgi:hypothetical protein